MFNLLKRSDARQVRQVLSGQSEAFGPLVERYLPAVYAVSYAYLGNHADAEDVTQEAFVSAYTSLHTLKEPKQFEGWVVSIARQTASKLRRKQRREAAATDALPTGTVHQPDPGREELRRLMRAEIERMDDEPREVLLLHYHAGMNAREIATALDINREAVKKRLQRARQTLSENLFEVIGEEATPTTDYGRQRKAIMGLVAAAGVGWESRVRASSMTLPAKIGGGALATLAALGAVYAFVVMTSRVPTEGRGADERATVVSAPDLEKTPEESVAYSSDSVAKMDGDETGGRLEADATGVSLTGYWKACNLVASRGFFSSWNGKSDIVYLEQIGDAVTMYAMSHGERTSLAGRGTLEDGQLRLAFPTSDGPTIGKQVNVMANSVSPEEAELESAESEVAPDPIPGSERAPSEESATALDTEDSKEKNNAATPQELVCRGTLSDGDYMVLNCNVEGGIKTPPFTMDAELTRLSERDVAEMEIMTQRIHEMESLATALKAYHTAYPSTFPEELSDLSRGFLDSLKLVESRGSRIVEYSPRSPWEQGFSERPEGMTNQHYLLQQEVDALAGWPDFPDAPPLFRIRYSAPPMILEIREANPSSVERVDLGNRLRCSSSPPTPATPEIQARYIESCQNNMNQLGLVLKMFTGEDDEKRIPAGWAMTIPDFLTDTTILTCPSVTVEEGSTRPVSYELLFPTINEEELTDIAAALGLEVTNSDELKHMVPMIVENHPCADGKSRNVVFWDGHAERIEDERWAKEIEPFVRAGDTYFGELCRAWD